MQNADIFMEQKIKEMDSLQRILNGRTIQLNQNIDEVKSQLSGRDDAGILEYFALDFHKIAQNTDSDLPQLKEISDQVQLKCNIKMENLNKFIDMIQAIQLEIQQFDSHISMSEMRDGSQQSISAEL